MKPTKRVTPVSVASPIYPHRLTRRGALSGSDPAANSYARAAPLPRRTTKSAAPTRSRPIHMNGSGTAARPRSPHSDDGRSREALGCGERSRPASAGRPARRWQVALNVVERASSNDTSCVYTVFSPWIRTTLRRILLRGGLPDSGWRAILHVLRGPRRIRAARPGSAAVVRPHAGVGPEDRVTTDEPTHLFAGYTYLTTRDFRLNPEHPPLLKELAALPLLLMNDVHVRLDARWDRAADFYYDADKEGRSLGEDFLFAWDNDAEASCSAAVSSPSS